VGLRANGFKGLVAGFFWPSAGILPAYLEDRRDAYSSSKQLVDDVLTPLAARNGKRSSGADCTTNIHLLAHSMGTYVVREAFRTAQSIGGPFARSRLGVSQVVLLSGDTSARSWGRDHDASAALYARARRLTNYQTPRDAILAFSNIKRLWLSNRVGRSGLPKDAPDIAVNVNCNLHLKWTPETTDDDSHSWYFNDDEFFEDLAYTLGGKLDRYSFPTRQRINGELFLGKA
jgi:esterase/lipase superfamily enzyme